MFDQQQPQLTSHADESVGLFESIANDIVDKGYSVQPFALPVDLANDLFEQAQSLHDSELHVAGIGREQQHSHNPFVRRDEICWIDGNTPTGQRWLNWTADLQQHLNRQLFMGLYSFESHYAHYQPGAFYKRHMDAFQGQGNRVLSLVVYLNPEWLSDDGGELVLYQDEHDHQGVKVLPGFGTLVAFLSEQFPHEVLPAVRDRWSIAGWFRINGTHGGRLDPPR
ncbi:2OG-Fe(II) oxygenase [Aestuariibacter halophilus]|uniref:2OG-Fe(II) oxygenase n=1 Tax=Fluctibacter halophilus TaxID=226011 RepID=A0ABS8G4I5_9ALTE|nr:2OG-Fe(II) oxygenase [Aestuariibacter halophilus]MCC2615445.1 2OG-Fe(II) oxygenase [Aestuariibacter halophilus]